MIFKPINTIWKKLITTFSLAFFLALLGASILPDELYTQDMAIHTVFIKRQLDVSMYQNDYLFQFANPQGSITLYYPFVATLASLLPIPITDTLHLLHWLYLFFLCLVFLLGSTVLFREYLPGILVILFMFLRIPIGGTATHLVEAEAIPRSLAVVSILWSLYFLYVKKKIQASFLFVFALAMHTLTALYLVCIFTFYLIYKLIVKYHLPALVAVAGIFIGTLWLLYSIFPENTSWISDLRFRTGYAFIDSWSLLAWIFLLSLLTPGLFIFYFTEKNALLLRKLVIFSYSASAVVSALTVLLTIFKPIPIVVGIQLMRIWHFPVLVSLVCLAYYFVKLANTQTKRIGLVAAITLLVIVRSMRPTYSIEDEWLDIQKWAKNNTAPQCVFLVPFTSRGFRLDSERAITGEFKDGAFSYYSSEFATEWMTRFKKLEKWEELNEKQLGPLSEMYKFDYIVSTHSTISFTQVYSRGLYYVYKMPNSNC